MLIFPAFNLISTEPAYIKGGHVNKNLGETIPQHHYIDMVRYFLFSNLQI